MHLCDGGWGDGAGPEVPEHELDLWGGEGGDGEEGGYFGQVG